MHNRRSGRRGYLALKLDVSKTYDRVEWYFLRGIMVRLGLLDVWIDRVMKCVTTPTFLVCINGKAYGSIIRHSFRQLNFRNENNIRIFKVYRQRTNIFLKFRDW